MITTESENENEIHYSCLDVVLILRYATVLHCGAFEAHSLVLITVYLSHSFKTSINCCLSIDISEARRHPKIVVPPHNGPIVGLAKEYAFNNYEYQGQGGNSHPVDEDTVEVGQGEPDHGQESDQQADHSHERDPDRRHEKHHHEHIHVHHTKSIHHPKKPGFSAGSGLRSIAQGSADQASSAVSNQVRSCNGPFIPLKNE